MSEKPKVRIKNVLVCDDIRREDNGKFILIGVYPTDIGFPKLPTQFMFMLWVEMDQPTTGTIPIEFRGLIKPANDELFLMSADISVQRPTLNVPVPIGAIPVLIGNEGYLSIQCRQHSEEWVEIKELPIRRRSIPSASARQQPA